MVMKLLAICFHGLLLLGYALLPLLTQVDVSGTWAGSIDVQTTDGESNRVAIFLQLKQVGTEVTGTFGPTPSQRFPIEKGTIDGDTLTFQVAAPTRVARVRLEVLDGGRMHGEVATEDGKAYGEMSVTREDDKGQVGRAGHASQLTRSARRLIGRVASCMF